MARTGRPTTVGGKQSKVKFGDLKARIVAWQETQGMDSFSEATRELVAIGIITADRDISAWIDRHDSSSVVGRLAAGARHGDGARAITLIAMYERQ